MSFWQTALIGYVSAGGLFFLVASILGRRNRKISAEPALALGEKPDSPLLAALLVSSIWPLILGMLLHSWIYDRRARKPVYRTLVATPDTLIDRLSLELIEGDEIWSFSVKPKTIPILSPINGARSSRDMQLYAMVRL